MQAVLDTSVYLSLLLSPRGAGAWLMALWSEERFQVVISTELFEELVAVSERTDLKRRIDPQRKLALYRRLRQDAVWTSGAVTGQGWLVDPKDDFLMRAALEVGAAFIVTWDGSLLTQAECQGVKLISPDQFISLVIRQR